MGVWKSLLNKKEEEKKEEEKETRGQESVTDIDIRAMETCLAGIWFCARKIAETNGSINIPVSSRRKGQSGKDHSTFQVRLERNCWPERSSVSGAAGGRGTKKSVDAGERSRRRRLSFFFSFFTVQQHRGMGASNFHFSLPIFDSSWTMETMNGVVRYLAGQNKFQILQFLKSFVDFNTEI